MRKSIAIGAILWGAVLSVAGPAKAYIFQDGPDSRNVLVTDQGTLNPVSEGWWLAYGGQAGRHDANNPSYYVGSSDGGTDQAHDFFVWDIGKLKGPITSASFTVLTLSTATVLDGSPNVLYSMYDVSTPFDELEATGTQRGDIWTDLGSGTFYGSQLYTDADSYTFKTITLDAAFIADLNAALANGQTEFAFGGRLDPVFDAVPEPATWMIMLLGFCGVGWMLRTNRTNEVTKTA